ncbi:MAG: hypothetical protein IJL32_09240 [Oscillospiraceae bacterium]|nr:hypothetical protein [Oscillospiraceae bacterium]
MSDFIDKDTFLEDVLPNCQFPTSLLAAVERQPIVHIDDMAFKIQHELQKANPSGIMEITFVRHGRWIDVPVGNLKYKYCSECGSYLFDPSSRIKFCPYCGAKMDGGAEDDQI